MKKAISHFEKLKIREASVENYKRAIYFLNFVLEDLTFTEMAIGLVADGEEIPKRVQSDEPTTPVVAWFEFEQLTISGIVLNMSGLLQLKHSEQGDLRAFKESVFLKEVDDMIWKLPKLAFENWKRLRIVQN